MPELNVAQLQDDLIRDEDLKLKAYQDSLGIWTIGVGHNLQDCEISRSVALAILQDDISTVLHGLDRTFPWWRTMSEPRQRALANLAFQIGVYRLLGFTKAMEAMKDEDFNRAADELLNSRWAMQTPNRARRVASLIRTG